MDKYLNKVIQGDCLEVMKDIPDKSVDMIFIDPPYQEGFEKIFSETKRILKENGQILWCVQPIEVFSLPEKPKQLLVWREPMSPKPIHKKYCEFYDIIAWFAYGDYTFNKVLWNLMGSIFDDVVIAEKRLHKWEKPLSLMEKLILVHTKKGDIILDPFAGSGTTGVASKNLNRKYILIEKEPEYIDIINKRLN